MLGGYEMRDVPKFIKYQYSFEPEGGPKKEFTVTLDGATLNLINNQQQTNPEWTKLDYLQCSNCPYNIKDKPFCPIASGLVNILETFKDTVSHHVGLITVTTNERTISKRTAMQDGISSLIGIFMVTSGCSIMDKLKPMVRYHLPFASINETIYRATSMYLLGQYFVKKEGKTPDWDLKELTTIYKEVAKLNRDISQRIRSASNEDASINALVILDVFAKMLPFSIEDTLKKLEYLYACYI